MLVLVTFRLLYLSNWKQIFWNYETQKHFSLIFHKSYSQCTNLFAIILYSCTTCWMKHSYIHYHSEDWDLFFYIQYLCILIFSKDAWRSLKVTVKNSTLLQKNLFKNICCSIFTKIWSSIFSILECFLKDHWSGGMTAENVALIIQEYNTF